MTSWFFRKTEGPPCPHRRCGGLRKCAFSSAEEYRTCNAGTGVRTSEGAPYAPLVQRQNIALVMRRSGVRISEGAPHTPLVQLAERRTYNSEVRSSNLRGRTIRALSSDGRAADRQSEDHRFKSCRAHHERTAGRNPRSFYTGILYSRSILFSPEYLCIIWL